MEKERRINWLSLLVKIIIIFVLSLIIIWIIAKIVGGKKLSDTFKQNINSMENTAVNYFKTIDLPQKKNESIKITLGEMIDKKLLISQKENDVTTCDTKKSVAKITRKSSNYIVETTLKCGEEKDTISRKFSFKNCKNCSENKGNSNNDKNNADSTNSTSSANASNSSSDNNSSSNASGSTSSQSASSESSAVTYYEYVKETVSYSKWMRGSKSGEDIENKNDYYPAASQTYYTLGYITKGEIEKDSNLSYTIKLNKVPNKNYYFSTIQDLTGLKSGEANKYLSSDSSMLNKPVSSIDSGDIDVYSLKKESYTYNLLPYYRKGEFYIDIDITINNKNSINYNKNGIALIPLKLNVQFMSNKSQETKPSGEYVTVPYYRYIERTRDTVWSSSTSLDGYTKTGNTKTK